MDTLETDALEINTLELDALNEASGPNLVEEWKQWVLGSTKPRTGVLPKTRFDEFPARNYNLKSKVPKKFLQHEKQTFGINLGWTDDASAATGEKVARWFFVRNGSGAGPIKYGETIAMGNGGKPSFLRHAKREFGIDLDWSDTPVFEWVILGGQQGAPVQTQDFVAIVNLKVGKSGEPLIYFNRNVGGDIGWPSSRRWEDITKQKLWDELKDKGLKLLLGALVG